MHVRSWVSIGLAAVALAGCGTRVKDEAGNAGRISAGPASPQTTPSTDLLLTAPGFAPPSPAAVAAAGETPSGATIEAPDSPAAARPRPQVHPSTSGTRPPQVHTTPGVSQPSRLEPGEVQAGNPKRPLPNSPSKKSPIVLASVGSYSGPVGVILVGMLQGTQVWVKHVNAHGGINGHPVQLIVYDDGTDPARHRAQLRDAVEVRHVVAFLANLEPVTGASGVQYINEKRIPVIGGSGAESWASSSPMYFPAQSTGAALLRALPQSVGRQIPPKTRVGTLVCSEIQECADVEKYFREAAPALGYEFAYGARTSLAQPDFTAECLAARNAKVEVLYINLDQNSVDRVATACARQGYRPRFAITGGATTEAMATNARLEGLLSVSTVFPFFQTGTPASDEFQQALRLYFRGTRGPGPAQGWVIGKLFERSALAGQVTEPPTTAAILAGLWSLRDETLGGLTAPLTFVTDRPAPSVMCWFNLQIKDRSWVSPDSNQMHCA